MSGNDSLWQKLPKDEKFRRELWLVVSKLKERQLSYGQSFTADTFDIDGLKPGEVIAKLKILDKQGVLDYEPPDMNFQPDHPDTLVPTAIYDEHPRVVQITLHDMFDELYDELESKPAAVQHNTDSTITVTLVKDGLNLYLKSSNGERVPMQRLRTDLAPDKLLTYLFAHLNTVILADNLKLEGKGFGSIGNVGERLRKAGFTPTIKKYFLPDNDKDKVRLVSEVEMSRTDFEKIKAELSPKAKSE